MITPSYGLRTVSKFCCELSRSIFERANAHFEFRNFRRLLTPQTRVFRFHSLSFEIDLLQASLGDAEIFFRSGQIESQLYQFDLRFATRLRQFFHALDSSRLVLRCFSRNFTSLFACSISAFLISSWET